MYRTMFLKECDPPPTPPLLPRSCLCQRRLLVYTGYVIYMFGVILHRVLTPLTQKSLHQKFNNKTSPPRFMFLLRNRQNIRYFDSITIRKGLCVEHERKMKCKQCLLHINDGYRNHGGPFLRKHVLMCN